MTRKKKKVTKKIPEAVNRATNAILKIVNSMPPDLKILYLASIETSKDPKYEDLIYVGGPEYNQQTKYWTVKLLIRWKGPELKLKEEPPTMEQVRQRDKENREKQPYVHYVK